MNIEIKATIKTDLDSLMESAWYATHPEPDDDDYTRMTRKLTAMCLLRFLEQENAPPNEVAEILQTFLELYPDMLSRKG